MLIGSTNCQPFTSFSSLNVCFGSCNDLDHLLNMCLEKVFLVPYEVGS